jgi:hypothetical protein
MMRRINPAEAGLHVSIVAAICGAVAIVSVGLVSAQQAARTPASGIPRTPEGRPDLSGVWIAGAQPLLLGEVEAAKIRAADAAAKRPPFQREPPPYKPEFEKTRQEFVARRGIDDPMARCLMSGVPRITVRPLPFQIIQTKDLVAILYEVHHAFRVIPTDGRPHPEDIEPSYMGDSVGRWEGDTLVVDVTGFNEKTWLAGVGTVHSEQLHVVERYRRDTPDSIVYDVTIEDPVVFTKPWRQQEILHLRPGERIREYECIENNEDVLRIEKLLKNESLFKAPAPAR